MTLHLLLMNLANYSAQIAALVMVGSVAPLLLRVQRPHAMLAYRQALLAACLVLPFLQSWNRPTVEASVDVSIGIGTIRPRQAPARFHINWEQTAALLLCGGMLARFCGLGLGLARLGRYRRRAQLLTPLPPVFDAAQRRLGVWPSICLSSEVASPVAFGIGEPVVLLPPAFLAMSPSAQEAIACHELTHVRRHDWAAAMLEESIRAVFWFHPGVWWLLGQIQLNREQAVDAEVIGVTASRELYIDALLAVAGGHLEPDLAPAPLFLRKTHLAQRVGLILKEASMSRKRLLSSLAVICGALLITARFSVLYFPISAPAQEVVKGEANLLHRAPIEYPADAIEKGIQGTVVVAATLDDKGVVVDARGVSGPQPLRKAAIKSVLDWHYGAQAQSPVEVAIDFKLPQKPPVSAAPPKILAGRLKQIRFSGPASGARDAVLNKLPVHEGDWIQSDVAPSLNQAVREVDEHLRSSLVQSADGDLSLQVFYATAVQASDGQSTPQRIRVGGDIQQMNLIDGPKPAYPPLAKQARIQGVVKLNAIIGKDGTVQDLKVASGDPLLAPPSLEAVRQWVYKPTLLNGEPVEVVTVIDINFTLSQ